MELRGKWAPKKHPTVKPKKAAEVECPCKGYFSEWDHKMLKPGETCQVLLDRRASSVAWHEAAERRLAR